jgi:hypothetical protein
MTTFQEVAGPTVFVGRTIPSHDETHDLAESIGKQLDAFRAYITTARSAEQADAAVRELLEAFLAAVPVDEDYTTAPEFLRVHDEGDGWAIDGATNGGRYTEAVWKYDTLEEAAENVPAYIRHIRREGYTIGEAAAS